MGRPTMTRTRFAPSPTGDLHLGGTWTALAAWALARASGGRAILRMEDIDTPRVVAGAAERIAEDLAWLGLDWDESPSKGGFHAPYTQSERTAIYEDALAKLDALGLTYPCDCSRAEIARVASAPHAGEETIYPGTCRDLPKDRRMKRDPSIRLRVPEGAMISFVDRIAGFFEQRVDLTAGDFVLRRGDRVFAYQLVVAVDDAVMGITDVVRASDLLGSTGRQLWIMQLLGHSRAPTYTHLPMVVGPNGDRLAKRHHATTVRELAARGVRAADIVGRLAQALGLVGGPSRPMTPREVARQLVPPSNWRKTAWIAPDSWDDARADRSA